MRKEDYLTTSSDLIVDRFLMRVQDYKLDTLNSTSGSTALVQFTEPWLLDAIDQISVYTPLDFTYTPSSGSSIGYFNADLSSETQNILSQIMVLYWLEREVNNILQINNFVTDRDFKTFSAAQNLTAKKEYLILKREEVDKLLSDYQYRHVPWTDWNNQTFNGSAV